MANKEVITEWVAALRSGDYPQTHGVLQNDSGYCCLGVLSELAEKAGILPAPVTQMDGSRTYKLDREWGLSHYDTMPPEEVRKFAGLEDWYVQAPTEAIAETYANSRGRVSLAGLNDEAGLSFAEIADVIEEQILNGSEDGRQCIFKAEQNA